MHDPHGAHGFYDEVVHLIRIGAATDKSDGLAAVDRVAFGVLLDEGFVPGLLYFLADFLDRIVPGDIFPICAAGPAHLRLQEATLIQDVLLERRALRAQSAAI